MDELIIAMSPPAALEYFRKIEQENNIKSLDLSTFCDKEKSINILSIDGDTATIEIKGILDNRPLSFCERLFRIQKTSYNEIIAAVEEIKADDSIKNVNLLFDTPGGMVKGVDEAYQALFSLRGNHRKVTATSKGEILSAGYWLASAANEIIASSPADMIGSIGVVVVTFDESKADEDWGIRKITIKSKHAENKNPDPATKEGKSIIQGELDALERIFHQRISEGRGISNETIIKNFGNGGIFVAEDPTAPDALSRGMIDKVISKIQSNPKNKHKEIFSDDNIRSESMTYQEIMAAVSLDEELKKEISGKLAEQFEAGKKSNEALVKKVSPYLSVDSKYPTSVKALALKVLSGESEYAALEGAVTIWDAHLEELKSKNAALETSASGETPPTESGVINTDKPIETDEEIEAAVKNLRQYH
jgi:ClpP class serine protease